MKILNVNISINAYYGGGTAERTYQMSQYMAGSGIDCTILTMDLGLTPAFMQTVKKIKTVSIPCLMERYLVPSFSIRSIRNINKTISEADVVHIMGHWSILNALAYIFLRLNRKPYVFCPAGTLIIHGRSKRFKQLYNWLIGNRIIKNASGHIASTTDEISQMNANGIASEDITLITNGIRSDFALITEESVPFREKYNIGNSPFILYVGTFSSIKGPDLLIRAFKKIKDRFPEYYLIFAGTDRGMLPEIKEYVNKYDLKDRVFFVGYLGGMDKVNAYCESAMLVVPSRSEVISMVALEAGMAGTPVLITDKCGFNEITSINGGNVVPVSVDGLEKGLIQMLSNPEKLKEMGTNLKRHIAQNYAWEVIVKKYIELYSKIV